MIIVPNVIMNQLFCLFYGFDVPQFLMNLCLRYEKKLSMHALSRAFAFLDILGIIEKVSMSVFHLVDQYGIP
ncbi:hypothetical protein AP3564_06200 [Aeribacillus pallidus]|uniref:Uncharacterized protein n=1 Tax=Aeribacillus pallidus TaxID=33936 RepID=A0A223E3Q4_9BACI|nr:hypothetical protein AP3564_06200 [Aeribacillus pallidus]